jgi:hypothetical protein
VFFSLFANFGFLLILFRERGAKSPIGSGVARVEWTHVFAWALVERLDGRFDVALLKSTPSRRWDFSPPARIIYSIINEFLRCEASSLPAQTTTKKKNVIL